MMETTATAPVAWVGVDVSKKTFDAAVGLVLVIVIEEVDRV